MLRKTLVAAALAVTLLAGCGTSEVTLGQWVQQSGLTKTLQSLSTTVGAMGSELKTVNQQDPKAIAWVLVRHGKEITAQARAIAAEPASSDTNFEKVRTDLSNAMFAYAKALTDLSNAKQQGLVAAIGAATTSLTALNATITTLTDYLTAHQAAPVHAA